MDSIIAENPDQSLDQLLEARKINQDQKAQAQKKPALQASLAQLEEQIAQYKQFDEDYQKRLATEKAALETSHKEELDKVKEASTSAAKAEAAKESKDNLLVLSKFLRAAAAKRQGGDETSPENRAFEGALLLVYGGEAAAVAAMESLIQGSDEKVPTVDQVPSEYSCKPLVSRLSQRSRCANDLCQTSKSAISRLSMLRTLQKRHGLKTSLNPNPLHHRPKSQVPKSAQILLSPTQG